ncbi:MAG: hypothetical protein ACRD21_14115, partial [Vicinamibacteria bacterium]
VDPKRATVSRIAASAAEAGRAYFSLDRHQLGDSAPYLFVTEDFGKSFRAIGSGLPGMGWVNVVLEHPRNPDLLFVGTETGLFVSFDRGEIWLRMSANFPTVPVDDLVIHARENDLVVGTHGRSIYVLDDITPLERHRAGSDGVELFEPRKATIFLPWKHESYGAQRQFVGANPDFGTLITYHLAKAPDGEVRIAIADAEGKLVRELEGPSDPGFHRVVWDLRVEGPREVRRSRGPLVPPDRYRVTLSAGGEKRESSAEVELDPRLEIPPAEFRARYQFLLEVNDLRVRLQEASSGAEALVKRLESLRDFLLAGEDQEIAKLAEEARTKIEGLDLGEPSPTAQSRSLFGEIDGTEIQQGTLHGPTRVQQERLELLEKRSDEALARIEDDIREALKDLNLRLRDLGAIQISPE